MSSTEYEWYLDKLKNSPTEMFWFVPSDVIVADDFKFDIYFKHDNEYDRKMNHVLLNGEHYDGIMLLSKHRPVSEREFKNRFLMERKEWNIVASRPKPYDLFYIDTYEEYLEAMEKSTTEMFWMSTRKIDHCEDFKFDLYFSHHNKFDRSINHCFLNDQYYDGVMLLSKNKPVSKKEIDNRFIIERKEWEVTASKPKPYDIIFISYNEPNADINYKNLCSRFPRAKRVHGVKGIHQAHIEAAKLSETSMFFVVDGDAVIAEDFNFDFDYIPHYQKARRETVYVWRSKNPVNGLEYGYGGVKLLPRELTLNVDVTSSDMTTSISDKFCMMNTVSNTTAYDTDDYSIWRSAFRECVKLASKTITGQVDAETEERLEVWQTVGPVLSTTAAKLGASFGLANKDTPEELRKINDYNWLYEQFSKHTMAGN